MEEPTPGRRRYYVQFTRIGTRRRVPPLAVVVADTDTDAALDDLADHIRAYARTNHLQGNVTVLVDPGGTGMLTVGGRDAGEFTWTETQG